MQIMQLAATVPASAPECVVFGAFCPPGKTCLSHHQDGAADGQKQLDRESIAQGSAVSYQGIYHNGLRLVLK